MNAGEIVSLAGFLLTDQEWQDDDLRRALLEALTEGASAAADQDSYESYELFVDAA
jgi:hypothetical protein